MSKSVSRDFRGIMIGCFIVYSMFAFLRCPPTRMIPSLSMNGLSEIMLLFLDIDIFFNNCEYSSGKLDFWVYLINIFFDFIISASVNGLFRLIRDIQRKMTAVTRVAF